MYISSNRYSIKDLDQTIFFTFSLDASSRIEIIKNTLKAIGRTESNF